MSEQGEKRMASVRIKSDVPYGGDKAQGHFLDIHWTREAVHPVPAVVVFNDDMFTGSDRTGTHGLCQMLAQRGCAVFNCDVRDMSDRVGIKDEISDALSVLRYVGRNRDRYGVDMGRIYAVGASYGGMMALWLSMVCNTIRLRDALGTGDPGYRIRGTGLISGITDIGHRSARMHLIRDAVESFAESGDRELRDALVPYTSHDLRTLGPVFQVTSSDDTSLGDCRKLKELLDTNKVENGLMVFDSSVKLYRGFISREPERPESVRAVSSMLRFLGGVNGGGCGPSGSS